MYLSEIKSYLLEIESSLSEIESYLLKGEKYFLEMESKIEILMNRFNIHQTTKVAYHKAAFFCDISFSINQT
jgi:hypothetical protein